MEKKDEELIQTLIPHDPELKQYYEEHLRAGSAARRAQPQGCISPRSRISRRSSSRSASSPARIASWRFSRSIATDRGAQRLVADAAARLRHGRSTRWAAQHAPRQREPSNMQHTISVLVENEFGVLARVAGLFSGRGFNIESLTVAETLDPTVSRITLVTRGDDQVRGADREAAQQADLRDRGVGLRRQPARRARDGADQGHGRREDARRGDEHRRHLPRQGHRRRPAARTSSR